MKKEQGNIKSLPACRICTGKILLFFLAGALLLSIFSFIQKYLAGYPVKIKGFIVPVLFGGLSGLVIGTAFLRLKSFSKEISKTRDFIKSIIDSMPSVLFTVDPSGKITHWNKAAENETSIRGTDLLKIDFREAVKDLVDNPEKITDRIKTGKPGKWISKIEKSGSEAIYKNIVVYPLKGETDNGNVIVITDITEDQRIRAQLEHSKKMDVIGQLAEGIAHDFNNMLGVIMGAADLIKTSETDIGEDNRNYTDMILRSAGTAAGLASKLMALGRKNESEYKNFELHKVIKDSVDILKRTIDRKVSISFTDNAENNLIKGDSAGLQSVLINLGINSLHAMEKGGKITIRTENIFLDESFCHKSVFSLTPGNYLKLYFTDTGCGMSEEICSKIFEPFFTTKKKGKGNGLGLSAVYETIINHNGFIDVKTAEGEGTSFLIYIPCCTG